MVVNSIRKIRYREDYGYIIEHNKELSELNKIEINNVYINNVLMPLKACTYDNCALFVSLCDVISLVNIDGLNKLEVYSVFKTEYDEDDGENYYLIVDELKRVHWYNTKYFLTSNLNGEDISDKTINEAQIFADEQIKNKKEKIIKDKKRLEEEENQEKKKKEIELYSSIFEKYIPLYKDKINLIDIIKKDIQLISFSNALSLLLLVVMPSFKLKILITVIYLLFVAYIYVTKIRDKSIDSYTALPDLRPLYELLSLDEKLFNKVTRTILFVDKISRDGVISSFIAEKITSTFIGMASLYKEYKTYTGKDLSIEVITSMNELVDSIDRYIKSLLSANEGYKKSEKENLDKILSDFAISNIAVFDSMKQFNNAFKDMNE